MLEFKFDTQLLIEGCQMDEDALNDYIAEHFEGDCLIVVGDEEVMKLHFHTNVEGAGILRFSWRDLRHRGREHAASIRRSARLSYR